MLDVDGTLVDSNLAHAQAWVDVFHEFGYDVALDKVQRLIGMGADKLLPTAIGVEKHSAEGGRLAERRKAIFHERYLPTLRPTRGARELLERLRCEPLRLAIASSAERQELAALLKIVDADDLVDDAASSEQVQGSKPDPDLVQVALGKLGLAARAVLMLGDTPYDVQAANRASVGTIALTCGGWRAEELRGALTVYADPADLLAHFDVSPLRRRAA